MFEFYYQQGNSRRKLFKVKGDNCAIGSARSNDLVVNSRMINKRHAELYLKSDGVWLRDLGSMQGSWVNQERVQEHGPLSELDEIVIGDVNVVIDVRRIVNPHAHPERVEEEDEEPVDGGEKRRGITGFFRRGSATDNRDAPVADARVNGNGGSVDEALTSPVAQVNGNGMDVRQGTDVPRNGAASTAPDPARRAETRDQAAGAGKSDSSDEPARARAASVDDRYSEEDIERAERLLYWGRIVHEQLLHRMDLQRRDVNRMSDQQLRDDSSRLIDGILEELDEEMPDDVDREALHRNVLNEAVGLGPLEQFLEDESITEVMVNNHAEIFLERQGKLVQSPFNFSSDAAVQAVIDRIITPLGRRIDESSPIVDARLKDGSRVNAIIPPLAIKGPSITIRKFPKHRLHPEDLVKFGSLEAPMVEFLQIAVERHLNVIVAGGTGSGKTTLLNVLSSFIPDTDRIVTIEDAAELKLVQPNLVSLESRPPNLEGKGGIPIRDLVKNSLRMRPDRIVVGECRGGEALDMLQAMNTGHDGSLTTIHANTPRDVISRLEVLVLMAGMDLPTTAIREQIASAVHLIIQQTRFPCGSRKVTKITEVVGVESGTVQLQDIFVYRQNGLGPDGKVAGQFVATGAIPTFYEELRQIGMEVDLSLFTSKPGSAL